MGVGEAELVGAKEADQRLDALLVDLGLLDIGFAHGFHLIGGELFGSLLFLGTH
jgi:hypothetical protein